MMNPPDMDLNHVQFIEEFKSNMQLLFHNKYTGKEGILLADITPMYFRYFNIHVTPLKIATEEKRKDLKDEFDWATALSGSRILTSYFKVNKERTHLLIKNNRACRPESEMKLIANLANFNVLNAKSYQQLINLVIFKFAHLPFEEKCAFKRDILQHLDENSNSDNQIPQVMQGEAPPPFMSMPQFSVPFVVPSPSIFERSFNTDSEKLLEEIIENGRHCNGNGEIPAGLLDTPTSSGYGVGRKRKPIQNSNLNTDNPEKKLKSSIPDSSALMQSSEPISIVNTNPVDLVTDTNPTTPPVLDDNVDISAISDTIENVFNAFPIETLVIQQDNGQAVNISDNSEVTENVGMVNGHSSSNHYSHSSNHFFHRPTCDVEQKICDNMAILKEFSVESDGKLDPAEWVIFLLSQDELRHYRGIICLGISQLFPIKELIPGISSSNSVLDDFMKRCIIDHRREKLNCQAKFFCDKSRTWKLHSNPHRKLRLPNKMIAFGEFLVEENGETYFEIIDCLKCGEDSNLLKIPFMQRYEKAQEMIVRLGNSAFEGIPVRMKPYLTMDNFLRLSGQTKSENPTGTALFINRNIFGFTNPRTLTFDNQVSLEKLLKQEVFFSPGVSNLIVNDNDPGNNVPNMLPEVEMQQEESNGIEPAEANDVESNKNNSQENLPISVNEINEEDVRDRPIKNSINPEEIKTYAEQYAYALRREKVAVPSTIIGNANVSAASSNHTCTVKCVNVDVRTCRIQLSNPFSFCKAYGWERIVTGQTVTYMSPCNKIFHTYKEVMAFLLRTDFSFRTLPYITIDFFSFEHDIRDRVEFPVWNLLVINHDISQGIEVVPITCVNEIDQEQLPPFSYMLRSLTGDNVTLPLFDIGNECICTDECQNNCCSCVTETTKRHTKGFVSSSCRARYKGYDFRRLYRCVTRGIYECNYKCKCDVNQGVYCGNRVIQNPIKWKLQVFRKADGWGVRTLHDIPKGHFVCQFIGKIVFEEEAANGDDKYKIKLGPTYDCPYKNCKHQLGDETMSQNNRTPVRKTRGRHVCLNALEGQTLYIDATHEGNVGRFINHGPKSNVFMQTVFIEEKLESRPHIAFFAKENILAGKEITSNFSTVRKGITEPVNEKESESFLQRPGPKKATRKGNQETRTNDSQQCSSQSEVPDRPIINDNDQLNLTNLCNIDNDDVLSQGSSRSSTTSYRSANPLPVVRLEKINVDQTLRQHKLTRLPSNPSSEANVDNIEQSNTIVTQVKTEPVDISNIKQEIIQIELLTVKTEKTEEETPFPHENSPDEILGNLDTGGSSSEMMVDNPETTISNSEASVSNPEVIAIIPVTVNSSEIVIDLTEDSVDHLDSQEHVFDLTKVKVNMDEDSILNSDLSGSSQNNNAGPLASQGDQEPPVLPLNLSRTEQDQLAAANVKKVPKSLAHESPKRPDIEASPSRPRRQSKKISHSQHSQPSTSKAALASSSSFSIASSQHSVKDCMKICCIQNESGFPEAIVKNKLFCCRVFGFERKFEEGLIFYEIPCGKAFTNEQTIFEFLLEAKHPVLSIDNFCFNAQVECSPTVWMNEQHFDLDPNTYTVTEDITVGQEVIPIRCKSSEIGLEPPNFRYISKYEYSEQYRRESLFLPENCLCDCEDGCIDANQCICLRRTTFRNELNSSQSTSEKLKKSHGYRFRKLLKPEFSGIFECSSMCKCFNNCCNKVVQNDMAWSLEVFNTVSTGWGVRTLQDIPQGAFVCNFVGLVKSTIETDTGNRQYQVKVTLPNSGQRQSNIGTKHSIVMDNKYIIDATREGNLARFINHSCSPNLFPQTVFVAHDFMKVVPYVAFFTNQDIVATTELTFDYKDVIEDEANNMIACFCGSSNCKEKFL